MVESIRKVRVKKSCGKSTGKNVGDKQHPILTITPGGGQKKRLRV